MARLFTITEVKARQEELTAKYRAEMRALKAMERVLLAQAQSFAEAGEDERCT